MPLGGEMKALFIVGSLLAAVAALLAVAHLTLIEVGREVVTLRTSRPDGIDDNGATWLHSGGVDWLQRFERSPIVELERTGKTQRYSAEAIPGPHPRIDKLLREKYGIADRWVRFVAPCNEDAVPVRLEPFSG
jgi:hypothetical protein